MKKNDLLLVKGEKNMQYARWATKEELKEKLMKIKKGEQISQVGIPLMYEENTMYIDKNRNHTLIIGSQDQERHKPPFYQCLNYQSKQTNLS